MNAQPDVKTEIGTEAIKIVSGARRSAYGRPEDNFERIARLWNVHLQNTGRQLMLVNRHGFIGTSELSSADVATFCRFIKEARLAETPDHRDSFVDIVGYTLCQAELVLKAAAPALGEHFEDLIAHAKSGGPIAAQPSYTPVHPQPEMPVASRD